MFSREIEYENFKGQKRTKRLHFNLTAPEILGLEYEFDEGFEKYIDRAAASGSNKMLFVMFELIVAKAYGRFSPDGETFVKKPEWHYELLPSPEYEALFLWIFAKEGNASAFYTNIIPKDLDKRLAALRGENPVESTKPKLQDLTLEELEAQVAKIKAGGLRPANEA